MNSGLQQLVLMGFFLFAINMARGQSGYVFQQNSETFQFLSGGTVLATATTDSAGGAASSLNSAVFTTPAGAMPFTFYYNGTGYSSVVVSSNGFITFGTTSPSTTNTQPISSTASYAGAVSGFGRDLIGTFRKANANDPDTVAQISYGVTGNSPQRKFVIEWRNFRPTGTAPSGAGPNFSFQIRLTECSNAIEIVYGPYLGGTWPSSTVQVGLRGSVNTSFLNRTLNSGQAWAITTAGTLNSSTCAYTSSTLPVSGLIFRFSPSIAAPLNPSIQDLTSSSVRLFWTSLPGSPSSYVVEWGVSGFSLGQGNMVSTNDTFLLLNNLTSGVAYQYYVRRDCGSGNMASLNAGPKNFTPGLPGEDCNGAIQIAVAADSATAIPVTVNSGLSQNGPSATCSDATGNIPDDDMWYKFTAPAGGKKIVIRTSAGTSNDWVMDLWSNCPSAGGSVLKCSDDVNAGMPEISICQNEYSPGQVFYIRVWTYSLNATGSMNLVLFQSQECAIPPSYDNCADAAVIPINPVLSCPANNMTYSTRFATPSGIGGSNGAAPTCDASTTINDVWLTFNTGNTGAFKITFGLGTATALRAQLLFECGGGGFEIQCMSNAVGTFTFSGLNPLADYVLRVWSPPGQDGTFTVCAQDLCDDPVVTISGSSTICPSGLAQLRFDMTGIPPWSVTYTNGSTQSSFTTSTSPYFVQVSPQVSTFYNLVTASSQICTSSSLNGVGSVTVIPAPTVTLAPFSSSVCSNSTISLSGGSPSGGVYSGPGVSGNQFNAGVAGVGTHTLTYTAGSGNGCQRSASQPITVITAPVVTSFSPASAFVGATVNISGSGFVNINQVRFNTTNAVSYVVNSPNSITATVPSGATTGLINVRSSNGCNANSTTACTIGPLPTVSISIKAFLEGYYGGAGVMNPVVNPQQTPGVSDSVTILIYSASTPYALLATRKVLIGTNGLATASLPSSLLNTTCYIAIKARSCLETWYKFPITLGNSNSLVNFTLPGSILNSNRQTAPGNNGSGREDYTYSPEHPE